MTCNQCNKTCKRFYNTSTQAYAASGTTLTLLGTNTVDVGCDARVNGNSIGIKRSGLYHISLDITFTGAAGNVSIQLYNNGIAMPDAIVQSTVVADTTYTAHIETEIDACVCCCSASKPNITVVMGGVAGDVTYVSGEIVKE